MRARTTPRAAAAALAAALLLAGCAGTPDSSGTPVTDESTKAAAPSVAPTEEHDAPLAEEAMLSFDDVCMGLRDAWLDGDREAAAAFVGESDVATTLFEVEFDPDDSFETSFADDLCIIGGNANVGVIEMGADGHVGARAFAMTWHGLEWWTAENYELWESGTVRGQALGPEEFLEAFAAAWGEQDEVALRDIATDEVAGAVLELGPGEVSVLWDEELCGIPEGYLEGACEALFMPEGQTECCAQIWDIRFWTQPSTGAIAAVELVFGGDAG